MKAIFLSASIPTDREPRYLKTSDPFLIQVAVREFVVAVLGRRKIVWGGHPTITPMVWEVCQDLGVNYAKTVQVYQSKFFKESFPKDNQHFKYVVQTEAVKGNCDASLLLMRKKMLKESIFEAAVFIGGMSGIKEEYEIFREMWPKATVIALDAPGGAARDLPNKRKREQPFDNDMDFVRIFHTGLSISVTEERKFTGNNGSKQRRAPPRE